MTARERLYIEFNHHSLTSGDIHQMIETAEVWRRTYPRDWRPWFNLSALYRKYGEPEKALEMAQAALRIEPHFANFIATYRAYLTLDRWEEAKAVCEQAVALKVDKWGIHAGLFTIAFVQGDEAAQRRALDWGKGHSQEWHLYEARAEAEEFSGRFRAGRGLRDRAMDLALRHDSKEQAQWIRLNAALQEAEAGTASLVRENVREARALSRDPSGVVTAATALARIGDIAQAQALVDGVAGARPSTATEFSLELATARAAIALAQNAPQRAVDALRPLVRYEGGAAPGTISLGHHLRGTAYLRLRQPEEAAAEFRKILDHRGADPLGLYYPLAHVGLARAHTRAGDIAPARRSYEDFLAIWKNADPDLPVLKEVLREYRRLPQ